MKLSPGFVIRTIRSDSTVGATRHGGSVAASSRITGADFA